MPVAVGISSFELHLPESRSLKDKRRVVKSLVERIHQRYRVSIAETDFHDLHQRAEISLAAVANGEGELEEAAGGGPRHGRRRPRGLSHPLGPADPRGDGMSRRTDRMADLLRAELADLLLKSVHDPRIKLVTVTGVEVSPDLRRAAVRISALGNEEEREATVAALRHAKGFLRSELANRLRTRVTPELVFELDRGAEHSQKISDLLESLHGRDESS